MRDSPRSPHSPILLLALLVLAAAPAMGEQNRVAITDPAVLESMGLSRDAKNVFQLVGGSAGQQEEAPKYFGQTSGFSPALGVMLKGRMASFGYACSICFGEIFNTNPATENFAEVQVDVPGGALLEFVRVWWHDTNVTHDIAFFFFELCQPPFGPGNPTQTTMASITSTGSAGDGSDFFTFPANTFADGTGSCTYRFRARFGNGIFSGPGDASLRAQKMRVHWRRRVSPAPATATFPNDVPTGHPFFQFVEALASSGITTGVAPGTYGVDQPITRGQMAVFLAVALGLDFGF